MLTSESNSILAIDFGTSHSLVGALHNNQKIESIALEPNHTDSGLMRSLIYFPNADECYYGSDALTKYTEFEMQGRLFRSFKSYLPNKNYIGTIIDNRILTLENMIGIFLLEIKKRAENQLGSTITKAVIGRPARYSMDPVADELALHRMKKAVEFAGFKEVKFVPEPLAAALDFKNQISQDQLILIGDFGGGTSDFTIMRVTQNEFKKEDVLGVEGCPVAGDALDSLFMQNRLNINFGANIKYRLPLSENILKMPSTIADRLNKPSQIVHLKEKATYEFIKEIEKCTISPADKEKVNRLFILIEDQQIFSFFEEIEKTKKALSTQTKVPFEFQYPDIETSNSFTDFEFEQWSQSFKTEVFQALDRCFEMAGVQKSQIDQVFLTGGTAHVPFIQKEFISMFGAEKLQAKRHFHAIVSGLIESARYWHEFSY